MNTLSRTQLAAIELVLRKFRQQLGDVQMALVATADGFDVASDGDVSDNLQRRLAAIVSSLHALGSAAGTEIGAGNCDVVTVQFEHRLLHMLSIRTRRGDFILAALVGESVLLGNTLWSLKQCTTQLGVALSP